jgi:hypothetical protein
MWLSSGTEALPTWRLRRHSADASQWTSHRRPSAPLTPLFGSLPSFSEAAGPRRWRRPVTSSSDSQGTSPRRSLAHTKNRCAATSQHPSQPASSPLRAGLGSSSVGSTLRVGKGTPKSSIPWRSYTLPLEPTPVLTTLPSASTLTGRETRPTLKALPPQSLRPSSTSTTPLASAPPVKECACSADISSSSGRGLPPPWSSAPDATKSGTTTPHRSADGPRRDATGAGAAMTPGTTTSNARNNTRW